jgi:predicted lipoprotein with Yx(FWY)xxD motif
MRPWCTAAALVVVAGVILAGCGEEGGAADNETPGAALTIASLGGRQLLEHQGAVVYSFSGDLPSYGSSCFGACAEKWMPVVVYGIPDVGEGVREEMTGSIHRPDGTPQITYGGWPLYERRGASVSSGAKASEAFGGEWRAMQSNGKPLGGSGRIPQPSFPAPPVLIQVKRLTQVGSVILDSAPKTFYYFSRDKPGEGTSACYGPCARIWKPKPSGGTPEVLGGAKRRLGGTFVRKDGFAQATYDGWPLYTYIREWNEQTKGFGQHQFGGVWGTVRPDGSRVVP